MLLFPHLTVRRPFVDQHSTTRGHAFLVPSVCCDWINWVSFTSARGQQTYICGQKSSIYHTAEMKSQTCQAREAESKGSNNGF